MKVRDSVVERLGLRHGPSLAARLLSLSTRPRVVGMTATSRRPGLVDRQLHGRSGDGGARRAVDLRRAARGLQRRTPLRRHAPPHRHPAPGAHRPARPARRRRHPAPRALPRAGPARAPRVPAHRQGLRPLPGPASPSGTGATATSPTPRARRSSSRTCGCGARGRRRAAAAARATRSTGRRDVVTRPGPGIKPFPAEPQRSRSATSLRGRDHLRCDDVLVDRVRRGSPRPRSRAARRRRGPARPGRGRRSAARRS